MGAGSIGNVTVYGGSFIAPGNSVGNLSVSALTVEAGGGYNWEIEAATGTPGVNWDLISVASGSGTVTVDATSGLPFTIYMIGNPTGWDVTNSYDWTLIDAGTLSGFSADKFSLDLGGFTGTTPTGSFAFSNVSGDLRLYYTAAAGVYDVTVASGAENQDLATGGTNLFTGAVALNKLGAGTLIMTNSLNDYSGVTTIKEGTIQINVNAPNNAPGALGSASTAVLVGDASTNLAAGFNFGAAVTNSRGLTIVAGTGAADRIVGTTITSGTAEQAGNVSLGTNATFSAASGGTLLVSGAVTGAGRFTKDGAGTVTLTGINTYSGGTLNSAGTLVGNTTSLQGVITNNASLVFDQSTNGTFASVISGTGTLAKTSAGTLTLSAANTYSGGSTISQGGVVVADNSALGSGTVSLVDGTSLSTDASAHTLANNMNVQGILFGGTGALTIDGNVTNNRGAAIAITNNVTGGLTLGNLALSHTDTGRVVSFFGTGNTIINGVISDGGAGASGVSITNSGITTLNGNNTYSGRTDIGSSGFLVLGNNNALGSTAGETRITAGGGTIDLNGRTIGVEALTLRGTGAGGDGALRNSSASASSWAGNVFLATASTITATNGAIEISGNIDGDNRALTIAGNANVTLSGAITNSTAQLSKTGTSTLTLSGNSTFSGGYTNAAGTLAIGHNNALGTGTANFADGSVIRSADSSSYTVGNAINFRSLLVEGAGALTFGGTLTQTAGSYTLTNNNTGGLTFNNVNLSSSSVNRTLTLVGSGNTTVTGVIADGDPSSTSGLTFNATGTTLTLSGANTYRGATTITAGTLLAASNTALGTTAAATTVADGATLAFSNNINSAEAITINGTGVGGNGALRNISGANTNTGDVTLNAASTIGVDDNSSLTLSNVDTVFGTRPLTVAANGTLTVLGGLISSSSASAITNVLQKDGTGHMIVSNNGTTGGMQLQVGNGTFTLAAGSFSTNTSTTGSAASPRAIDLGTSVSGDSANNVAFYANSGVTVSNSIYVAPSGAGSSATRTLGTESTSGTATFNREIYLDNSVILSAASDGTAAFTGNFVNNGGMTKVGAGTVILAGTNAATGTVVVGAGTLAITNGSAIADGNAVTFSNVADAILAVNSSETVGAISGGGATGGTINLASGQTLTTSFNTASNNFAGTLTGAGGLTKAGSGTLSMSGANSNYSGQVTLANGALLAGADNAFGTGTLQIDFAGGSGTRELASLDESAHSLNNSVNVFFNALTIGQTTGGTGSLTIGGTGKIFNLGDDGETRNRVITVNGSHTIAGNIEGGANNNFVKEGAGTIVFTGANTFNGGLFIDQGTVDLAGGSLAGSVLDIGGGADGNAVNASNAMLRVSTNATFGRNITINAETGTAGAAAGTRTIEFANTNGTATLSGTISHEKAVTVNVTNAGATGVLSGVISSTGGGPTITVSGNGTLGVSNTGNTTDARWSISSGATLAIGASRNLGVDPGGYYSDKVTLNGGTLSATNNFSLNSNIGIQIASNSTISVGEGFVMTNPAVMGGTAVLTKAGNGILVLSAANTNGGGSTLSAGVLRAAHAARWAPARWWPRSEPLSKSPMASTSPTT